eukprot:1247804-Pyramimonas_sp.AAC.1
MALRIFHSNPCGTMVDRSILGCLLGSLWGSYRGHLKAIFWPLQTQLWQHWALFVPPLGRLVP